MGIFLSAFINFGIISLSSLFLGYFWLYLSSLIFGFMAGIINKSIKLSILSGAGGIFFSWFLPLFGGVLDSTIFGYLIRAPASFYLVYIIPTILFGALGGGIGGVINKIKGTPLNSNIQEKQTKDQK
jgi:uncharacterized membrane protein YeaQ/YmgE (transglycosylase-associated protein family)